MTGSDQGARGNLWIVAGLTVLVVAASILGYATWAAARGSDLVDLSHLAGPTVSPRPAFDAEAAAITEILTAYRGYRAAKAAAWQAADPDHPDLDRYVGGHLRSAITDRIDGLGDRLELTGEPALISAEVTHLDLAADPPIARVTACVDARDFVVTDPDADPDWPITILGDLVPGHRHAPTADAQLFPDGVWRMVQSSAQRDDPC